jgi:hypothetical protein
LTQNHRDPLAQNFAKGYPPVKGRQRAGDRMAELRGGKIGSLALRDAFGPKLSDNWG